MSTKMWNILETFEDLFFIILFNNLLSSAYYMFKFT